MYKKILKILIVLVLVISQGMCCCEKDIYGNETINLSSSNYCLMESNTGSILVSSNEDEKVSPASITKIMTVLLACEKIEDGSLKLTDMVTTSAHAKSMGGSQVFLEEGEKQSVEDMLKCIVIASGNDACVALAEHISGSEEQFVQLMNKKAKSLGMDNTHFTDCCGLSDSDEHYTSARDVAIMSRELVNNHPMILKYSSTWMDKIVHVTKKGNSDFLLSNTNKLIRMNENVLGLKTGSTSKAGYCLSAYAKKENLNLIAVIMGADNNKMRFDDANKLINYGMANCNIYGAKIIKGTTGVVKGKSNNVAYEEEKQFCYLLKENEKEKDITKEKHFTDNIAPIHKGDVVGEVIYKIGDKEIGKSNLIATNNVKKADLLTCISKLVKGMLFKI